MRTLLRQMSCGAAVLLFAALPASAQEPTTITGTVLMDTGAPVQSASIFIESMSLGVLSNPEGRYILIVPAALRTAAPVQVTASQIGRTTQVETITLQPGTQVLNFVLSEDPLRLEGFTTVALGMERQSRTLGISTQQLRGSELTRVEPNVVNALTGKVAGIHINNSGPQGGSTRIVIRGENSITGGNQPLFIVNGVPIDNTLGGVTGGLTDQGGYDYGNPIQDINPEDIASITVLKGPNAAALYGSRAANGAVLIETKRGQGTATGASSEIVVSQQVTFEDELRLPDYQNVYGGGYNGDFSFYDGFGNGTYDEADESWGPPLDVGLRIPQWFSTYDPLTDTRAGDPWVSHPDNIDNFFDLGMTATTNVSVAGATENVYGRAAYSRMNMDGMQPGHEQKRNSFSFAGALNALERFTLNTSVQYIASEGLNRPGVGYGSDNVMGGFVWWNRNIDTNQLKSLYDQTRPIEEPTIGGFPYSWTTLYWVNPYFKALKNRNEDSRNRLIGQISASYALTPWLTAQVRTGTDWYQDERLKAYAANPQVAIAGDYTTSPMDAGREYIDAGGSFGQWDIGFQETNTDFLVTANPELGLPISTNLTFGGNRRDYERKNDYTWVGRLTAPGIYDVSNAASVPERFTQVARKRVNSLYGQADFGYNDYLFLTVTGRNDWSSTLPENSRSYFYPSVSSSLVFTDLIERLQDSPISYGKLRASWARVGNDTNPYRLRNTFAAGDIWNGLPSFSVPGRLENPDLRPEITESWEFGTELGFMDNRLGVDLTYYVEETRDQLMPVQLSATTGYASRMLNAGSVENKGWEVLLRGTPYSGSSFRWESTLTWAKNNSKVVRLAEGVEGLELSLGDFWGATLFAREGEPLGQIVGSAYRRDPDGNIVVSASAGVPLWDDGQVIGNVNPDWRAGWANEFSYGGASLGVLLDMREGGQIYSVTNAFGRMAGQLVETIDGRCGGGAYYPDCDETTGIVFDGVNEVSEGVYEPNTTVVDAETFWLYNYFVEENNLEDAGYIKLREVTLSYGLPDSWVSRWGVNGVDLSLVGRNLALWTDARHLDPETALEGTNVQGFEYGQMPAYVASALTSQCVFERLKKGDDYHEYTNQTVRHRERARLRNLARWRVRQ